MIVDGFYFLSFILFYVGLVIWYENKYKKSKFFTYVPAIIIIYFTVMWMSTLHLWEMTESVKATRGAVKSAILPAMIFLMLLRADLRDIIKLGPRMVCAFFIAATSIVAGFLISFLIFKGYLADNAHLTLGALAGSWIGGVQNMVAVQQALNLNDAGMGYTLLIDSIDYSIWIMFLLALVPFARRFNAFTRSDTSGIDEVTRRLTLKSEQISREITFPDMMLLVGFAFGATAVSMIIGARLPAGTMFTATTWTVVLVTVGGILAAMTPLGRIPGAPQISNVLLYTMIALVAANANFAELTQAPAYILCGFVILAVHLAVMVVAAKLFKLDLFTCGVASCANIGGVASTPVLAGTYSQALVPIGVLMALLGVIVGTGGGILVAYLLRLLQ